MKKFNGILSGYENTRLIRYGEAGEESLKTVCYDDLPSVYVEGVLKGNRYVDGRLMQTYSERETHVAVVAATRLGKTTQYVIPTILSFAMQPKKRSMVISDPKGELYKTTSETLKRQGYNVKLLNFRNFLNSEYWNPLTPIFRAYRDMMKIEDEVKVVETENGLRNEFRGVIYDSQTKLDMKLRNTRKLAFEDIVNAVDEVAVKTISTKRGDDPYWEDSARELLKAVIWGMLEDSDSSDPEKKITEHTFSFGTVLSIMDSMRDGTSHTYDDGGYFTSRPPTSKAFILAKNCIIENASTTRKCIVSTFNSKMSVYRSSTVRMITSCNSFEMEDLFAEKGPVAIYIDYKDEMKAHYEVISSFVQNAYGYLINYANAKKSGKLDIPFYFILDEFGNFPAIKDFENVISACGGRNIYFILVLQSYAQLSNVYGKDVAEIIRDNMNQHVFIGSNNPDTLEEFSRECGMWTRVAPVSALVGNEKSITDFRVETIPLMPKSTLGAMKVGECVVTEANCGYVMLSKMERFYLCKEMNSLPVADESDYFSSVDALDDKYIFVRKCTSDEYDM